jgi:C4-dicarboxylate transporter, DctM subunit
MNIVLIIALFVLFLSGMPICFSLGIVSMIGIIMSGFPIEVFAQKAFSGIDTFSLIAVPLFIMSGELMGKGGVSRRMIEFSRSLVGHIHGSLAIVAVIACMLFAAVTGAALAASVAIGGILIVPMVEDGYDKGFIASLIATAGSIGPIIPPSITLVLYGVITNTSIASLFIGGVVPGVLMGMSLIIYCYFISKKRNYMGAKKGQVSIKGILSTGRSAILALLMPVIIIGGIIGGIFTPTEAAGIAVVYALLLGGGIYRELKWSDLPNILKNTAVTTGTLFFIVSSARVFMWYLTINQLPQQLADFMIGVIDNKYVLLAVINIILLFSGTFIDTISNVVIFVPLFLPLVEHFDINLIHFGVVVAVNLTIGMCTPPLGISIFATASIAKIKVTEMFKDLFPQIALLIGVLILITYIPETVLFVVNALIS